MVIRQTQMSEMGRSSGTAFEDRLLSHIQQHFPVHWREAGAGNLRIVVQKGISDASSLGLETQREIYLFVSLMLYLGSGFHNDFQLPWVAPILNDSSMDSFTRVDKTYAAATAYLERVAGANGEHSTAAIRRFIEMLRDPGTGTPSERLALVFPQKYRLLNQVQLARLQEQGREQALAARLTLQHGGFICEGLSFLLGHGYANDPQFAWAGDVLKESGAMDGEKRVMAIGEIVATRLGRWAGPA